MKHEGDELLDDTLVDALLEEHLGGDAPPDRAAAIAHAARAARPRPHTSLRATASWSPDRDAGPRPLAPRASRRLFAAALLLAGAAAVVGTALLQHADRSDPGPAAATQDPSKPRAPSNVASAFFPLSVGSRWDYVDRIDGNETPHSVVAAVAVRVGDDDIVQLADCAAGSVAFTFWSADDRGIRHHISRGVDDDPLFQPAGLASIALPSPVGAQATWSEKRAPARALGGTKAGGFGAGLVGVGGGAGGGFGGARAVRTGRNAPIETVDANATLLGLEETLRIGDRDYRCAHVRVAMTIENTEVVEESWYARGIGLVRRATRIGDGAEAVRELVRFTPAQPLPDRDTLLATHLRNRATDAKWIDLPADEETAWTLRASFACLRTGDTTQCYALVDDQLIAMTPTYVDSYQLLARMEDFGPRMDGLFPQRLTHGLCRLATRLRAAETGCTVRPGHKSMSVQINAGSTQGHMRLGILAEGGGETVVEPHCKLVGATVDSIWFAGEGAAVGK